MKLFADHVAEKHVDTLICESCHASCGNYILFKNISLCLYPGQRFVSIKWAALSGPAADSHEGS